MTGHSSAHTRSIRFTVASIRANCPLCERIHIAARIKRAKAHTACVAEVSEGIFMVVEAIATSRLRRASEATPKSP